MWLIAGLGNPGPKYAGNRHNIGFMVADELARHHRFSPWSQKFSAHICEGSIAGEKILLIKPQTYMNLSGQSVGEASHYFKIEQDHVLVLHDELDLASAKVRVKRAGGHGGHNGLKDIDRHIGKDYWRARIGIGHPGDKDLVHDYVLSDFSKEQRQDMNRLTDAMVQALPLFFEQGHEAWMSKIALLAPAPKPAKIERIEDGI